MKKHLVLGVLGSTLLACSSSENSSSTQTLMAGASGMPEPSGMGGAPVAPPVANEAGAPAGDGEGGAGGAPVEMPETGGAGGDPAAAGAGGAAEPEPPADTSPMRCDPGEEGNGTFEEGPPYDRAPESQGGIQNGMSMNGNYDSEIYGYGFQYRIYVPDSYSDDSPAALMVFQDGIMHYINDIGADAAIDRLIADQEIPVSIGLFINPTGNRGDEYNTPDDKYARFLTEEIIPDLILDQFPGVVMDPDAWATIGFSSGGIAAFSIGWWKNDFFQKVLTHNSSFPIGTRLGVDYAELVDQTPDEEQRDLRVGLMSNPGDNGGGTWFETNTQMAEVLTAKGYDVRYIIGEGSAGHYPPRHPSNDLPDSLRWLWQGCEFVEPAP